MAEQRNGVTATATAEADAPSLGELVAAASRDMSILVRSEIALAKAELSTEAKKAAAGGGMFGAAAFLGLYALTMLSFAAAYGIVALGLDEGWSFLTVGGAYLLIAGLLILVGVKALKKIGPPERTLRTAKETVHVLKTRGKGKRSADKLGLDSSSV